MDLPPRSKVNVRLREKHKVEADSVEVHFKDTYLTRADMWRISSTLTGKCLYSSQRVSYLDVVRASVNDIYRNGKKRLSAYIGPSTKFVYRSESARTIFFMQMSSEMWHFEENGEVVFHKLINSFLPELFKRWREQGAHHVVTIVLFTSVDISGRRSDLGHGERERNTKDYFRVVVDQVHINRWSDIMASLRYEFSKFAKDVMQKESGEIEGQILPAVKGNLLEAISLATTMTTSKFLDRDLRQTNSQVIVITPGSGIFDVDYDLLYQTSTKLLSIEISIDIVCLSRRPLHVTPLFRFKRNNKVTNCVPSWVDISFWKSSDRYSKQWIPRCKIYEIQMMGVMENEVSAISIDYLPRASDKKSLDKMMDEYDENLFNTTTDNSDNTGKLHKNSISNENSSMGSSTRKRPSRSVSDTDYLEKKYSAEPPMLLNPKVSSSELSANYKSTTYTSGNVSNSIPASAILSSPEVSATGGSSALLTNTIKTKPSISKMSALSSLFNFGGHGNNNTASKLDTTATTPNSSAPSSPKVTSPPSMQQSPTGSNNPPSTQRLLSLDYPKDNNNNTTVTNNLEPATGMSTRSIARPPLSPQNNNFSNAYSPNNNTNSSIINVNNNNSTLDYPENDIDGNNYIWVTISNPSNVPISVQNISNFGRWKNVFPKGVKRETVKWRSLKSPASLPLATEIFPSLEEFERNYTFQIYDVTLDPEKEDHMNPGNLLEEMVSLRLCMGFQVVVGDRVSKVEAQRRPGGNPALIVQTIPPVDYHGIRIYMSRSNQIHRLAIDHYGTINVQLYRATKLDLGDFSRTYHPLVKTKYEEHYQRALGNFFDPSIRKVNWNLVDQLLAGYDDVLQEENSKMFKIRFVIIPADVPKSHPLSDSKQETLSSEEIRLEGLKRLITQIHKGGYLSREEKNKKKNKKKEIKSPEIKFYTGELGDFLLSLFTEYKNYYNNNNHDDPGVKGLPPKKEKLFVNETMSRSTIKLNQLAVAMQGERGIRLVDRRWHWKLHKNCFIGQEFVRWILDHFTDVDTSEDATEYGNELMEAGLFHHVEHRHTFLDGHYFYQLNSEYILQSSEKSTSSWFKLGSSDSSSSNNNNNNATPNQQPNSYFEPGHSRKSSGNTETTGDQSEYSSPLQDRKNSDDTTNAEIPRNRPKVLISRAMKYDIDPNSRSNRHEFLTFHLDRVHNPENAFHLRVEWINATPKLIEEAIVNLARLSERWGLKLVQVPIDEVSALPSGNPFCSLIRTKLSVDLPSPETDEELKLVGDPLNEDPQYYHKFLLQKYGFVVDTVPASSLIKEDVEIVYSWGKPFYMHPQYIHKTGTVLIQIVENNEFASIANTLHVSRIGVHYAGPQSQQQNQAPPPDAEEIQFDFKRLCEDPARIQEIITEAKKSWILRKQQK